MPKLNQIIALTSGKKTRSDKELTGIYQSLQKAEPLMGITRVYTPKDEEGERLPSETKRVQTTVGQHLDDFRKVMTDLMDITATLDNANCRAKANVAVDGKFILKDVPVTHLLFLERQLQHIRTVVSALPTLDPAESWEFDENSNSWVTEEMQTVRTKKIPRNHVRAEATKEHPAQVDIFHEDVVVGTWNTKKFSGAIPQKTKSTLLERVERLQDAIKIAREEANTIEAEEIREGHLIFDYLFPK